MLSFLIPRRSSVVAGVITLLTACGAAAFRGELAPLSAKTLITAAFGLIAITLAWDGVHDKTDWCLKSFRK